MRAVLYLSILAASGVILPAQAQRATSRSFPASGFDRVALSGADDVIVTTGSGFSVRASGDPRAVEALEIVVERGALQVRRKQQGWNWGTGNRGKAVVRVTMPRIVGASLAGSGDMTIDRGEGNFNAAIAGSGDMAIGRIDGRSVNLSVSGSGDLAAAGQAQQLQARIGGSGTIQASGLRAGAANVSVGGSGNLTARVSGDARVSVAGSGSVDLGPGSRCRVSKAGSGSVRCGSQQ